MSREIEIRYELNEILPAVRRYWLSASGWFFIITAGLLLVALGLALSSRIDSIVTGFLSGALTMLLLGLYWSYVGTIQETAYRIGRLDSPEMQLRLTNERIGIQRKALLIEMDWRSIDRVLSYGNVWLLFERQTPFMMLSVESIDEEARQFILDKVKEHGGKIG
jgi:hypothetical protein